MDVSEDSQSGASRSVHCEHSRLRSIAKSLTGRGSLLLLGLAAATLMTAWAIPAPQGHPVSSAMLEASRSATGLPLPDRLINADDTPRVIVFILPDCPCSESFEPLSVKLFEAFHPEVSFLGVVVGTEEEAARWQQEHRTPYPLVSDAGGMLARSCGAERSAYTLLTVDGQTISKIWPGYSQTMLQELELRLAKYARVGRSALDFSAAPVSLTSGCPLY